MDNIHQLKVGIGTSTSLEPEKAGKEVIIRMLSSLHQKPKFVLLFSTIHYEKEKNGMKKLVSSAYNTLSKDIPLIGGTVSGFITNQDLFIRGAVAIGIYYPKLEVTIGYGNRVKQNPKKAGRECAEMIKNSLSNKYSTKLLINYISGAIIPKIPLLKNVNYIKSKIAGKIFSRLGLKIIELLGMGVGKEDDVIEEMAKILPEFYFFGGTTIDNFKYLSNYQFLNNKVYTNSVVGLGLSTNLKIYLVEKITGYKTKKTCKIDSTIYNNRVITKIENMPAEKYYFENFLGVNKELFQFKKLESFYYKASVYFPIGFEENPEYISGTAGVLGKNILLGYKSKGRKMYILSVTGKSVINSVNFILEKIVTKNLPFLLFSACGITTLLLGNESYRLLEIFQQKLGNTYFLIPFFTNENYKLPYTQPVTRVYSYNLLSFKG